MLKFAASLYDPLGLISPVITRIKILFQLLCKDKLDWDDKLSDALLTIWTEILSDLKVLSVITVNRFVLSSLNEKVISVQLHGFCDSSQVAYCAVIYLRMETSLGVKVKLLTSKSKVTPLKSVTIPRLELLACSLLCNLFLKLLTLFAAEFLLITCFVGVIQKSRYIG